MVTKKADLNDLTWKTAAKLGMPGPWTVDGIVIEDLPYTPYRAYIDGRDLRATPPLTLVRLNVWAGLPRRLNPVVGQIAHGKRVRVMERRHCGFERREMARIRRWFLTGWVPATWLSQKRRKAVGTLYEPAPLAKRRRSRAG